jgi:methionine-rich copper-binding protein CopC
MPLVRRFAALAAALALVALMPAAVLGHSELEQADPAPGATISEAPTLIVADFTEAIDPTRSTMELRGPDGAVVATGGVAPDDPERVQMTIVPPALGPGTYEVRWTTVSPDDNGILRGTYTFTIAVAAASPSPALTAAPSAAPSASPSAAASAAPSTDASAVPSTAAGSQPATATPSPSGGDGSSGSSGGPGAILIVAGVALLAVIGGVAVYLVRGRRT